MRVAEIGMLLHRQGESRKNQRPAQAAPAEHTDGNKEGTGVPVTEGISEGHNEGETPPVKKSGRPKKTV